jgi:Gas vesicle protein
MSPERIKPRSRRSARRTDETRRRVGRADRLTDAELVLGTDEATLLDIVDNVLSKGVVLTGDLTIALAQVDLVYARLSLLLCAADRVMPGESPEPMERHAARHAARIRERKQQAATPGMGLVLRPGSRRRGTHRG